MGGVPVQTTFQLSPHFCFFDLPPFLLERGAHKPSLEELRVPFYQDPAQRIVALVMPDRPIYSVFRVQALLGLLEDREGSEVGWDEWKGSVIIPSIGDGYRRAGVRAWVSGCRFFCLDPPKPASSARMNMNVFDFSVQGRVRYLSERGIDEDLEGVRHLSPTEAEGQIPWRINELIVPGNGHDSVVFSRVSTALLAITG